MTALLLLLCTMHIEAKECKDLDSTDIIQFAISGGKAIPLQAWTGPKGYRRLRLPDFKTIGT